jgi:hypothetical protein
MVLMSLPSGAVAAEVDETVQTFNSIYAIIVACVFARDVV